MRRTLRSTVVFRGAGLHGGQSATARILPADRCSGIVFVRTDLPPEVGVVPARYDLVSDTRLCTKLTNAAGVSVSTIEHIMAALAGCGISDAIVEIDGPEVPILDGSSLPFVRGLHRSGSKILARDSKVIQITETIEVEDAGRIARLLPSDVPEIAFSIRFDDPAIGEQRGEIAFSGDAFTSELAECRTFCKLSDVEALRRIGLAQGGGLENAIVVDSGRVLNPEGLRRPDEFVRHKMLDAIGDLALAGAPIMGRYEGVLAGHEMTNRLVRELFARPDAWDWADADDVLLPSMRVIADFADTRAVTVAV
ncbi:MAG: UDP-3-O-acyl-N-acetylglucosamine deacetylase [Pseudomonadota bacterium]